jgi:hypothetical protein
MRAAATKPAAAPMIGEPMKLRKISASTESGNHSGGFGQGLRTLSRTPTMKRTVATAAVASKNTNTPRLT